MIDHVLTVTQVNEYLRLMMEGDPFLSNVYVCGEISNFTNHYKTGHFYFSLKDETGTLRAVMFRSAAQRVTFRPENGMRVILGGRVSVFSRDGQYQLYVSEMQPDGIGALYVAYEQLRRKLESEGLFDAARKKPIPRIPEAIGVVTSETGAAVRDILDILGRRFPLARVILYPALVQGVGAAESVASGVRFFSEKLPVDVIIVGRGGGSMEDLWAFNDEALARTIAAASVPVISAVGHETDFTLCDFVADLRAPTPSAAAELAVPDGTQLKSALDDKARYLYRAITAQLAAAKATLSSLATARSMRSPRNYIEDKRMALSYLSEKLDRAADRELLEKRNRFGALCAKAEALSPLKVLTRGYAAIFKEDGTAVSRADALAAGDEILIRMSNGTAQATVRDVRESE